MSHGAGGDETEVVPPVTEVAPELAWSACEDEAGLEPAPAAGRSWARTCGYAALIGVVPAGLLILIFGFPWYWFSPRSSAPAPSVAAPTPAPTVAALPPAGSAPPPAVRTLGPVAVPPPSTVTVTAAPPTTVTVQAAPPPAPTVAPVPRDSDRIFREGVSGIPGMHIVNWDVAEAGARSICGGFAHGMTRAQVVDEVQRNDPTFTTWQTSGMVNVALAAYCPQYEGN
ncbi:DUF732 domain-containing protein [Mycobacterium avium]|uniref:DUF732 domain-containing protein n=1 Tax=Mycobacterium avium TaxID=1764 RepID=UPI00293B7E70|nr:DUF732 domain-containing protein [Mycobacterium avium]MDV3216923.1 DUF732 domain-containing protein [Mycobacterium avium]